jgi:hypothetical protein
MKQYVVATRLGNRNGNAVNVANYLKFGIMQRTAVLNQLMTMFTDFLTRTISENSNY